MPTDPLSAARRESRRRRRLGSEAACTRCYEWDPRAIVLGSAPRLCYECVAEQDGRSTVERHHVGGRKYLELTVLVPANDHRILSDTLNPWACWMGSLGLATSDVAPLALVVGMVMVGMAALERHTTLDERQRCTLRDWRRAPSLAWVLRARRRGGPSPAPIAASRDGHV